MPKAISIPPEPEFDTGLVVPAPGDGASSAVIEAALQQLLNNDGFLNQLAGAVANNLASHIAATNPHQATPNPTGDRLVLRDAEGRAAFGAPNAANHAARLADVAAAINGLPAVLRDPSAWAGLAGALLQVNEEENGLEAAHISQTQLNTLLQKLIAVRVSSAGTDVSNIPGRLELTAARPSTGVYTLTAPAGHSVRSLVVSPIGGTTALAHNISGLGDTVVTISWRGASSGTLVNTAFSAVGEFA